MVSVSVGGGPDVSLARPDFALAPPVRLGRPVANRSGTGSARVRDQQGPGKAHHGVVGHWPAAWQQLTAQVR